MYVAKGFFFAFFHSLRSFFASSSHPRPTPAQKQAHTENPSAEARPVATPAAPPLEPMRGAAGEVTRPRTRASSWKEQKGRKEKQEKNEKTKMYSEYRD